MGANVFSMAIVGPFIVFAVLKMLSALKIKKSHVIFIAVFLGDILIYITTSIQLALAFPDPAGGVLPSFIKFSGLFAITQIPIAIIEGLLTVMVYEGIKKYGQEELELIECELDRKEYFFTKRRKRN